MKIDENQIDLIMTKSLEEKYKLFRMLENEYPEWQKEYNRVRYGVNLKFDINFIWQKQKMVYAAQNGKMMVINNTKVRLEDYNTEVEDREKIIDEALLNNVEGGIIEPR